VKVVKNEFKSLSIMIAASCLIIFYIDKVIMPVYLVKSIFKVLLFLGVPAAYSVVTGRNLFKGRVFGEGQGS